jgi:glycosyltransferase involved in cell wall biosynthesis
MRPSRSRPIRVLHVLGRMDRGGVETWLMHVLRNIDRESFQFDFLTHSDQPCAYDEELRALGCRILPCLHPARPWPYARQFRRILRDNGPYDVVHSHVHHYSGFVLHLARKCGVQSRIAHSHNDKSPVDSKAWGFRRIYLRAMEHLVRRNATLGLACSRKAAQSLYGMDWDQDSRWRVLYYGIDLAPFGVPVSGAQVRAELNLPPEAWVVGHVGRFSEQKNHAFLLDVIAGLVHRQPQIRALLIGEGALQKSMEDKAKAMGIDRQVVFAGSRADVPRLMLGAMDLFLLPSLYEGLGLVLIEAQAAGLPCVVAEGVPDEADVVPDLVTRLSLSDSAEAWAQKILAIRGRERIPKPEALERVKQSAFNIVKSAATLCRIYESDFGKKTP